MSLIRGTSNPERVYAFNVGGDMYLHHNIQPPLSKGMMGGERGFSIPTKLFEKAAKLWVRGKQPVTVGKLDIREMHVFTETGKPVPEQRTKRQRLAWLKGHPPCEFLIRVKYGTAFVFLWEVTWEYMIQRWHDEEVSLQAVKELQAKVVV